MRRRLLTSMFGVAIAAILVFGAGVESVAVSHPADSHSLRLSPLQVGLIGLIALVVAAGLTLAQAGGWPGPCGTWPGRPTGSARATPGRSAGGTGSPSLTGSPKGSTAPSSG